MINQHTEMRDQLQERHEDMVNDINPYTNCRVELHGLDMTRDTSGPSSKEILGQADMTLGRVGDKSCMCIIYYQGCSSSSGRRLAEDVIKVNDSMPNRQGEKMFETMISMMSAMSKIMEKLDMDPVFDPKKKAKSPKKPKQAKQSESQEDETAQEDIFKRNLLAVEEVVNDKFDDMKSHGDLLQSNIESMKSQVKSVESNVESIESKVESMESKVQSIEGKVDNMEKTMDEMKDKIDTMEDKMDTIIEIMTQLLGQEKLVKE